MFKVCLDDFSGTNIENIAMLLEGCGRFLLRSDETRQPFGKMVSMMLSSFDGPSTDWVHRSSSCEGSRTCSISTNVTFYYSRMRITRYSIDSYISRWV